MLFIDHDQAQLAYRGKNRRAGANDDLSLSACNALPFCPALAGPHAAVHNGDLRSKTLLGALDQLVGQPNLGDQHLHPLAATYNGLRSVDIHLGFPTAGYPVQQKHPKGPGFDAGGDLSAGCRLFSREVQRGDVGRSPGRSRRSGFGLSCLRDMLSDGEQLVGFEAVQNFSYR